MSEEGHFTIERLRELQDKVNALEKKVVQLEEECSLHEKLNDASIDRILAFDENLKIIAWNKTSELITGIPSEEVIGEHLYTVFPDLKICEKTTDAISNALKGFKSFVPADKVPYEGGYYENHYIPLKENDKVTGVLNIKHDVAHRVKYEQELKSLNRALVKKNKELKQKNAEISSFTHITSHDLKEPARKIYTFSELILSKEGANLTDTGRKYFKRIQIAAQRMGMLTDDILTYSQLNAEEEQVQDVDMNHVVAIVKDNLTERIIEKDAVVTCGVLPTVKGYRTMLLQLFSHLIQNALKFQQSGNRPEVNIHAETVKATEVKELDLPGEPDYIRFTVSDNGIGFDKKYAGRIFQMFQRLHNAEDYPGTGMGLALCLKITEIHHGTITAEGTQGKGSKFQIYLPGH